MPEKRRRALFSLPEEAEQWRQVRSWCPSLADSLEERWARDENNRMRDEAVTELHAVFRVFDNIQRTRSKLMNEGSDGFAVACFEAFVRVNELGVNDSLTAAAEELLRRIQVPTQMTTLVARTRLDESVSERMLTFVTAHSLSVPFANIAKLIYLCGRCTPTTVLRVLREDATTCIEAATNRIETVIRQNRQAQRFGEQASLRHRNPLGSVSRRRVVNREDFIEAYGRGDFEAIGVDYKKRVNVSEASRDVRSKFPMADLRTYVDQLVSEGTRCSRDLITAHRMQRADETVAVLRRVETLCARNHEESNAIVAEFRERHGPSVPTYCCASCGVRDPSNVYDTRRLQDLRNTDLEFCAEDYDVLKCMKEFKIRLPAPHGDLTFAELAAFTFVSHSDGTVTGFWLNPKFVDQGLVVLCSRCWEGRIWKKDRDINDSLYKGPPGSLARGIDYGTFVPSQCANVHGVDDDEIELNKLEALVVSRTRRLALSCTIDCGYGQGAQAEHVIFSGHVVTFPQHTDVAKNVVDDITLTDTILQTVQNMSVTLTGPPQSRRVVKSRLMKNELTEFNIRPKRVAIWMAITKALRDRNAIVSELSRIAQLGDEWPDRVMYFRRRYFSSMMDVSLNTALIEAFDAYMAVNVSIEHLSAAVHSEDFARAIEVGIIERDEADQVEEIHADVAGVREPDESGQMTESVIFNEPCTDAVERGIFDKVLEERHGLPSNSGERHVDVPRDDSPLTEYGAQQALLLEMSWPHLFVLPNSAAHIRASNRRSTARLVTYFDNRFDGVPELYHFLFDMHVRHDMQSHAKLAVTEEDVAAFVDLQETITDEELREWQRMSSLGCRIPPKARELIRLIRITRPISVPFTSAHRRRSAKYIRDMARAFGSLCLFWTFNPDDKSGNVLLRLTMAHVDTNDRFPVVDDERWLEEHLKHSHDFTLPGENATHEFVIPLTSKADLLKNAARHPVRVACEMDRLAKSFVEVVLGVKTTPNTWIPKIEADAGVYGHCAAAFYVIEEDGRHTPHVHGGAFGFDVDPMLLETSALFEAAKANVADWIRSVSNVAIPDNAAVCREVERAIRMRSDRTFGIGALPVPEDATHAERVGHVVAAVLNHHRHVKTCDRAKTIRCRLCMPELHGIDKTDLSIVSLVPAHTRCPHDRFMSEISFVDESEGVDIDAVPLSASVEREHVHTALLDQYRVDHSGNVPTETTLANPCPHPVNAPIVWMQARPFVDEVRHEDDERGLRISTASLTDIATWLESGPARHDDMRFPEVGAYLREVLDTSTQQEQEDLLNSIRQSIRCTHGYTAPYNALISGLLRCNTSLKLSYNAVMSESQLAYTTEYCTKCPKIQSSLASCARALKRWREHGSTAIDNGTFDRMTTYVHQSASQHIQATQGDTEMSDTILAMAVCGAHSDYFSCIFQPVNQDRDLQMAHGLLAKRAQQLQDEEAMQLEVPTLSAEDEIFVEHFRADSQPSRAHLEDTTTHSDSDVDMSSLESSDVENSDSDESYQPEGDELSSDEDEHTTYNTPRLRLVRPGMKKQRNTDSEAVMRYGHRGAALKELALYFYYARYVHGKRVSESHRNGVFAYDPRFNAHRNDFKQIQRSQFAVISWTGRGRPLPTIQQIKQSAALRLRFAKLVLLYFVPWDIDNLPNFHNAESACADFLAHCESVNATDVQRATLEIIRRLVRESTVPFQTKSLIQALRARHSDTLPWRGGRTGHEHANTNGHASTTANERNSTNKERMLALLLEAHERLEQLTPAQKRKLTARSRFQLAFARVCASLHQPREPLTHRTIEFWEESESAQCSRALCQRVRARFKENSQQATNVHNSGIYSLEEFVGFQDLTSFSTSQAAFLCAFEPYITALNKAQNQGGIIKTLRHGKFAVCDADSHQLIADFDLWKLNTLLLGGPGTGKTHTIHTLIHTFERYTGQRACVVAPTGAAASLYVGRGNTVHTSFADRSTASDSQIRQDLLISLGCDPQQDLGLVIVDEVSMLAPDKIHLIDTSLRAAQEHNNRQLLPFGGVPIIFVGDFFQLRPVRASSVPSLRLGRGVNAADAPNAVEGAHLLCKCALRALSEQMRAAGDPGHALRLQYARNELSVEDILQGIHNGYFEPLAHRELAAEEAAKLAHTLHERQVTQPLWPMLARLAPLDETWSLLDDTITVVCMDNTERHDINHERARARAQARGDVLVRWRTQTPLTDSLRELDPTTLEHLFNEEDMYGHHLWQSFLRSESCLVLKNYNVLKRVSNGSKGRFYALVWYDATEHRESHELIRAAIARGESTVDIPSPPDEILVEFKREDLGVDSQTPWPDDQTIVPGKIVLPFDVLAQTPYGEQTVTIHGSIAKQLSGTNKNSVPAARFQVDLALALTQWKVQGATVDKIVLWLPPRSNPPRYTADGLYVLFSRVASSDNIRYVPYTDHDTTWAHLSRLRFPQELHDWLSCFVPDRSDPSVRHYDFAKEARIIQEHHIAAVENSETMRRAMRQRVAV